MPSVRRLEAPRQPGLPGAGRGTGGIITNFQRELELAGVQVHKNAYRCCEDWRKPGCGARADATYRPDFPQRTLQIVDAWQVLRGEGQPSN